MGTVSCRRGLRELIERFKTGRTSVQHEEGAGRPSTSITVANTGVRDMLQNRRVTVNEVAHQLQISHGSVYEIIHNRLAFHKVCAQWVPEQRETFGHLQTAC